MPSLDFPNSPTLNQVFESGDGRSWTWTGTTWDAILTEAPAGVNGQDGQDGKYIVSDTAPLSPEAGDAWFDSTVGKFFIYYDNFWVEFGTATGPAGAAGTDGADGADGGFNSTQTIQNLSQNYTITTGDEGKLFTNSAAITVTVQGLTAGQQVDFIQTDAGQITFVATQGITLASKDSKLKTAAQYSPASLKFLNQGQVVLVGDLGA